VWYSMLIAIDEREDLARYLYLDTTAGQVVILFQDKEKLRVIARSVLNLKLAPGESMQVMDVDVSSIEEAAREIRENDPLLRDAIVLTDSDPFVTRLVVSLRPEGFKRRMRPK